MKKFTFLLFTFSLMLSVINASASTNLSTSVQEQLYEKLITVKLKDVKLKDALYEVQKLSGISFVYDSQEFEYDTHVSITAKNEKVKTVLDNMLSNTQLSYSVVGNGITIYKNTTAVSAEEITVKGVVKTKDGKIAVGATVLVENDNTKGAITDNEGAFILKLKVGDKIIVSYTGYLEHIHTITAKDTKLVITIEEDEMNVEEVVVGGIFKRRTGSFTGSANILTAEELKRVGNSNVFQSLKSLDPSLMIFDNLEMGSDPNTTPEMILRGRSTIDISEQISDIKGTYGNDPNAPLFILDGFETTVQQIMDLDMNRIESLTILKDASAKAIYGSKAANGVILIESRKTGGSNLRVTYNGSLEVQAPDLTSYNLTNAAQKLDLERTSGLFTATTGRYEDQLELDEEYYAKLAAIVAGIDTDWLSKPLHTGVGTKHALSFDMSSESLSVGMDFSYNKVTGVMKGSDRQTYSGSANVAYRHRSFTFRNMLSITSNIANDSPYGQFSEYAELNPYYTPYDENGLLVKNCAYIIPGESDYELADQDNPLYNAQLNTKRQNKYFDVTNNFYAEWNIMQGLRATGSLGYSYKTVTADEFYPSNHLRFDSYSEENFARKGSYQQNNGWNKRLSSLVTLQYNVNFNEHHDIFANIGYSLDENAYEEVVFKAEGFPNERMTDILFAKQYAQNGKPTGNESTTRDIGIVSTLNYTFKNKYIADFTYRTSAASQYGANSDWGEFWSVGAGWNINKENFLINNKDIALFKLRGSVGYTGAQSSQAYNAMASYAYILDRTYQGQLGANLSGMRNEELEWQTKMDYNIGIDFNYKRSLMITFDYYVGITKNNLISISAPYSTGFTTYTENAGTVKNKGFDTRISYVAWQKPSENTYLTFTLSLFSNDNTITNISSALQTYNEAQDAIASDATNNKPVKKFYDNVSTDAIWAVPSLGIDPANGREIYIDKDGNPTYTYSASNQTVMGNALPKISGVGSVNFQYKGFGLNASCRFNHGASLYNSTLVNKVENADITKNVDLRLYEGVWKQVGDNKPYKKMGYVWAPELGYLVDEKTQPTSRFVQKRNEFSLSNVSLSYDFRDWNFMKKTELENMKLSFYMNDVFIISSIEIERGTSYPFARAFNFALSLTF